MMHVLLIFSKRLNVDKSRDMRNGVKSADFLAVIEHTKNSRPTAFYRMLNSRHR